MAYEPTTQDESPEVHSDRLRSDSPTASPPSSPELVHSAGRLNSVAGSTRHAAIRAIGERDGGAQSISVSQDSSYCDSSSRTMLTALVMLVVLIYVPVWLTMKQSQGCDNG